MRVKICGIKDSENLKAAVDAGAAYVGFVIVEKSPRFVCIDQAAELSMEVPTGVCKTVLLMDPTDALLQDIQNKVGVDMIQLHGAETPQRVAQVRALTGLPVMKAVGVASSEDLAKISLYSAVADQILLDAKPPQSGDLPGGTGVTFDWRLIAGRRWAVPWMLAGGLTPQNVAQAIELTGAKQIDVSSGVEVARGVKSPQRINAFIKAANMS